MPPDYETSKAHLNQLRFDPENPRLPPYLRDVEDPEPVLEWMLADGSLLEIMGSLAASGYFPGDPLLISPIPDDPDATEALDPADGGDWVVVEGNRRYASLILLREPDRAPRRRQAVRQIADEAAVPIEEQVPVVAFPNRDAILTYLGFRHITGVKDWDPLEKARFLAQLRTRARVSDEPFDNKTLARQIGSKGPYVGRLLAALEALRRLVAGGYFEEYGVDEEDIPFSLLSTALNYESIVRFLELDAADDPDLSGLDEERLRELATWLFVEDENGNTALRESRNMRYLAAVVESPIAREALSTGTPVRSAALLAFQPDELFNEAIDQAASPISIAREHADAVENPEQATFELVQIIRVQAHEIEEILQARLTDDSERQNGLS